MILQCFLLRALVLLAACDNNTAAESTLESGQNPHSTELQSLIRQVKANLVFVEGGDFLIGDLAAIHGP